MGIVSSIAGAQISRRNLLTAGVVAAASVVTPSAGSLLRAGVPADPYRPVSREQYARLVGSTFRVHVDSTQTTDVVLTAIEDARTARDPRRAPTAMHDAFSLVFTGSGRRAFPQGTYQLDHSTLGTTMLLLVPDARGRQVSTATINRL